MILLGLTAYHYGSLGGGWAWANFPAGAARVFFSFPAGVLIYRASRDWKRIPPRPWLLFVSLLVVLWAPVPDGALRAAYDFFACTVAFPILVCLGGMMRAPTDTAVCKFFGATSYAIYILHYPVLFIVSRFILNILGHDPAIYAPWLSIAYVLAILAAAFFAERVYDVPFRSWVNKLYPQV